MKKLPEIAAGSSPVPPRLRGSAAIGALAVGLGVVPIALALGWLDGVGTNLPGWVLISLGSTFIVAGGWCVFASVASGRHRRRVHSARRHHPERAELGDFPWHADGTADRNAADALRGVVGATLLAGFLAPLLWWAGTSHPGGWPLHGIVGAAIILVAVGLGVVGHRVWRAVRFGRGRLRFASSRIEPGSSTLARLVVPGEPADGERIEVALRFVEERLAPRTSDGLGHRHRRRHRLWERRHEAPMPAGVARGLEIEIPLDLPADRPDLVTELSRTPPRYWEVEIRIVRTGIDYVGVFPLPVYPTSAPVGPPPQPQPI